MQFLCIIHSGFFGAGSTIKANQLIIYEIPLIVIDANWNPDGIMHKNSIEMISIEQRMDWTNVCLIWKSCRLVSFSIGKPDGMILDQRRGVPLVIIKKSVCVDQSLQLEESQVVEIVALITVINVSGRRREKNAYATSSNFESVFFWLLSRLLKRWIVNSSFDPWEFKVVAVTLAKSKVWVAAKGVDEGEKSSVQIWWGQQLSCQHLWHVKKSHFSISYIWISRQMMVILKAAIQILQLCLWSRKYAGNSIFKQSVKIGGRFKAIKEAVKWAANSNEWHFVKT